MGQGPPAVMHKKANDIIIGANKIYDFMDCLFFRFEQYQLNAPYILLGNFEGQPYWFNFNRDEFHKHHMSDRQSGKMGLTWNMMRKWKTSNREDKTVCEARVVLDKSPNVVRVKAPGKFVEWPKFHDFFDNRRLIVYRKGVPNLTDDYVFKSMMFKDIPSKNMKAPGYKTSENAVFINVKGIGGTWFILGEKYRRNLAMGTLKDEIDRWFEYEKGNN